ncbi:MAG: ParA family protein [Clostridia bacterium]|nr:ParA family protein [Clostridia bacterium]
MGKIISFANQKGGVGKTTSAVNIAAALGVLGYKVLLIDLDPQGNATSGVGIMKKTLKVTAFDMLTTEATADDVTIKTKYDNLSVIPTHTTLARAEYELGDVENGEFVIKNKLATVKDRYDYIIIDCPPSLGMLTVNAMTASDGVVIPMQCEFFALEGLSQLMFTIGRIKNHYNKDLNVTGILITMHNSRLILSMQVISELRKHYADKLFETTISRNVKVSEAPGFGAPVYYHEKRSKGSVEYMNVAKELAERI